MQRHTINTRYKAQHAYAVCDAVTRQKGAGKKHSGGVGGGAGGDGGKSNKNRQALATLTRPHRAAAAVLRTSVARFTSAGHVNK